MCRYTLIFCSCSAAARGVVIDLSDWDKFIFHSLIRKRFCKYTAQLLILFGECNSLSIFIQFCKSLLWQSKGAKHMQKMENFFCHVNVNVLMWRYFKRKQNQVADQQPFRIVMWSKWFHRQVLSIKNGALCAMNKKLLSQALSGSCWVSKGWVALPNRMIFWKKSKRLSNPLSHFWKIILQFFMTDMVAYIRGDMMAG